VVDSLIPGGMICLEAFHTDQIHLHSGGPTSLDLLMDVDQLAEEFKCLDIIHLVKTERILNEGPFHQGKASLVQLIAKKIQ
jgi:hypothetical protein